MTSRRDEIEYLREKRQREEARDAAMLREEERQLRARLLWMHRMWGYPLIDPY